MQKCSLKVKSQGFSLLWKLHLKATTTSLSKDKMRLLMCAHKQPSGSVAFAAKVVFIVHPYDILSKGEK